MAFVFSNLGVGDLQARAAGGGFPKLTTAERDATTTDAAAKTASQITEGVVIYNLTTHKLNVWTGAAWEVVTSA
jgi:hypothetical protein